MPNVPETLEARFWAKVHKGGGCWEWTASKHGFGYGQIGSPKGYPRVAHRLSWQIHYGKIPAGMAVCHRCDNPPCVRPDHLFLGTLKDNMMDCAAKGRVRGGAPAAEKHFKARLSWEDVRAIRASTESDTALGERYGVRRGQIWNIRKGGSWKEQEVA